jgi:N-acetyltransferase
MARTCVTKRKRGFDLAPHTTTTTTTTATTTTASRNANNINNITSPKNDAASAIRIGCDDSPIIDDETSNRHAKVCSIRDDIEPISRQSSLLSFFTKAKRAKPKQQQQQKPKQHANDDNLTSRSGVRSVKTKTNNNRALSSSPSPLPLPPSTSSSSSSSSSHRSKENNPSIIQRGLTTASLMRHSTTSQSQSQQQRKSKSKSKPVLTQVYIDCGQSKFGQILCKKCGMLYMPGIAEDETQHKRLCQAYTLGIPCNRGTVKGGKQVGIGNDTHLNCNDDEATIVLWRPCVKAHNSKKSKGEQGKINKCDSSNSKNNKDRPSQWPLLARMISKDLGTHEETTLDHLTNEVVFLCIGKNAAGHGTKKSASTYRILGVVTVQLLGKVHAYRMISLYERSLIPSTEAKLGIGLLWTHPVARNRGIATRLVHAAREHSVFGMKVARQDVAFSNPTQAGYNFALRYSNINNNSNSDDDRNTGIDTIGTSSSNAERGNDNDDSVNLLVEKQQEEVKPRRGPLVYEMNL